MPLFKGVPGKVPFRPCTCISVNEEVVHGIPGQRTLERRRRRQRRHRLQAERLVRRFGDHAIRSAKCRPKSSGCWMSRSGVLDLAIELMGTKTRWSEVAREMATYVRDAGFSVVESFVGHGIGRKMHEEPQVPNFVSPQLRRNNDFRSEPGLVIAVEPMVNMGTKKTEGNARPLDASDAGRPAERPFRAHDRDDRRRSLGADRPADGNQELHGDDKPRQTVLCR